MFYRCEEGTEAYQAIGVAFNKIRECCQAAATLAEELGAESFTTNELVIGGIGSLCFNHKPSPKQYKVIGKERTGLKTLYHCVPDLEQRGGRAIAMRIVKLPFLKSSQIHEFLRVDQETEKPDEAALDILRIEGYYYMQSDFTHHLEGLEEISEQNFQEAAKYAEREE